EHGKEEEIRKKEIERKRKSEMKIQKRKNRKENTEKKKQKRKNAVPCSPCFRGEFVFSNAKERPGPQANIRL
ncbi:MAG: hypothetical protein WBW69_15785, partial [Candidatus Korobacteraceae bacterium]